MYPVFVTDVKGAKQEIPSLPGVMLFVYISAVCCSGQYRWGVDRLDELVEPLVAKGLSSLLIFGLLFMSVLFTEF